MAILTPNGILAPSHSGVGLRSAHMAEFSLLSDGGAPAPVGFLEIHSENFFGGGAKLKNLAKMRRDYPLSMHGVGLSLGRADALDLGHIAKLKSLIERFEPALVSEHLSWSAYGHSEEARHVPDLLALPRTHEALQTFIDHVNQFQDLIGRQVLIENPSNYLAFAGLDYDEPEFLMRLASATGCGILLDLNNVYVSARNLGLDPYAYLEGITQPERIGQFHLAGHLAVETEGRTVLIDTHGDHVCDDVMALYAEALRRFGNRPTLIEWDTDLPPLEGLLSEAARVDRLREQTLKQVAHA
jgi:uncharacterized protein